MRKLALILILTFWCRVIAQTDYSGQWEDLFSYTNVKDFVKSDEVIYAVTDNAVFIYDTQTEEVRKISTIQGLSGGVTTSIHYSATFKRLVIGYEDGLLEVIDEDGKITSAPEIRNFNQTGEKSINHIYEYNDKLYLATAFAVVVYDIDRLEFGDTYFIAAGSTEEHINQLCVLNDRIYAATENGIYSAEVNNPNLIDFNNWTQRFTGNFQNIITFNNQVIAARDNALFLVEGASLTAIRTFSEAIKGLKSSQNTLSIALDSFAVILSDSWNPLAQVNSTSDFNFKLSEAMEESGQIYLGTTRYGILKTSLNSLSTFQEIHPDGPLLNDVFSLDVHNDNLWVVYGGYDATYTPVQKRNGFSYFNGTNWKNTPFDASYPLGDLISVTMDKNKEGTVFISAFGDTNGAANIITPLTGGLLYFEEGQIQNFYNQLNSPLEDIVANINNRVTIRVGGTALDRQGNLWVTNIGATKKLKKLAPDGSWKSFDIESIVSNNKIGMNEVVVDRANTVWIGTRRNGVFAFNENGDRKIALTTEATKGSLPNLNVRTVAVDRNNRIWLGTLNGLVVFNNALGVFDSAINDAEPIIILDEGVPKRLLGDQTVNSIAVDGADNKWFGTDAGGVLYTNPSGEETLAKFNKDNSPLPANKIIKIKVDEVTGKVYFATSKGMVVYDSKVVPFGETLGEVYAYPNPVLKKHANVTIDGRNGTHLPKGTNVKILDVAGNLVFETNVVEGQQLGGGKVMWDKKNLAGVSVASGVYIVLLSNEDNTETSSTKIAIIN